MRLQAYLYADIVLPEAYLSPEAAVLTRLMALLVVDYLNESGRHFMTHMLHLAIRSIFKQGSRG